MSNGNDDGFIPAEGAAPDEADDGFIPAEAVAPAAPAFAPKQPPEDGFMDAEPAGQPWGFTEADVEKEAAGEDLDEVDVRLKLAMEEAERQGPRAARIYATAQALGVKSSQVEANFDTFVQTAKEVSRDTKRFRRENPLLTQVITKRPDLAPSLLVDQEAGDLLKAIRAAGDWVDDAVGAMSEQDVAAQQAHAKQMGEDPDAALKAGETLDAEAAARKVQERAARDAPRKVEQVDSADARAIREEGGFVGSVLTIYQRGKEARARLSLADKQFQLALAERRGDTETATRLWTELHDAEVENAPLYLGETGLTRDISQAVEGGLSMVDTLASSVKGAGIAGTAAALVTGIPTAIATRSLAAGVEMGTAAARVVAAPGAKVGAAWAAFQMEFGPTYVELRQMKTEGRVGADGKLEPGTLTTDEALGAAIMVGGLSSSLELFSFNKQLAPAKTALASRLRKALAVDPTARQLAAKLAKEWAEGVIVEGGTEGVQEAIKQFGLYLAERKHDGKAPAKGPFQLEGIVESAAAGSKAGLLFAGFSTGLAVATTRTITAAQQQERQLPQVLAAAKNETIRSSPQKYAEVLADLTGETGTPVEAFHLDARAAIKYYQENEANPEAAMERDLGEGAAKKLEEAAALKQAHVIPMHQVLSSWGTTKAAQALIADTATQPGMMTPREFSVRGAEVVQEAVRIANEEMKKASDVDAFDAGLKEMEGELIATRRVSAKEARTWAATQRRIYETLASNQGITPEVMLKKMRIQFMRGGEGQLNLMPEASPSEKARIIGAKPAAGEVLQARTESQDRSTPEGLEGAQRDFWIDSTTGALNERAWKRLVKTASSVADISVEGIKFSNDKLGGHEAGNATYAAAARALQKYLPEVAKVKGDFKVRNITQQELDAALEKANADPVLQGFRLSGVVQATAKQAEIEHKKAKHEAERQGQRAERGNQPLGSVGRTLKMDAKPLEGTAISDELRALLPADAKAAHAEQYIEPKTGLYTKDGRDRYLALHPRKHWVAIDLNLLNAFNRELDEPAGDSMLDAFGQVLFEAGGERFIATHVSGDEYSLHADNLEEVQDFLAYVSEAALEREIKLTTESGQVFPVRGMAFGVGIGENVDVAELALIADKEQLAKEGYRGRDTEESRGIVRELLADPSVSLADVAARRRARGEGGGVGSAGEAVSGPDAGGAAGAVGASPLESGAEAVAPEADGSGAGADQREAGRVDEAVDPSRREEAEAKRQGFNQPEDIENARQAWAELRRGVSKAEKEAKTRKARKAAIKASEERFAERKRVFKAFIDWVEGVGPRLVPTGLALAPKGVLASPEMIAEVRLWARDLNLLDPEDGVTMMMRQAGMLEDHNAQLEQARNRPYHQATTAYEDSLRKERRSEFKRRVLGRVSTTKTYLQLPTPEQSAEGVAAQQALLDALLEVGAQAIDGEHELVGKVRDRVAQEAVAEARYTAGFPRSDRDSRFRDSVDYYFPKHAEPQNVARYFLRSLPKEHPPLTGLDVGALKRLFTNVYQAAVRAQEAGLELPDRLEGLNWGHDLALDEKEALAEVGVTSTKLEQVVRAGEPQQAWRIKGDTYLVRSGENILGWDVYDTIQRDGRRSVLIDTGTGEWSTTPAEALARAGLKRIAKEQRSKATEGEAFLDKVNEKPRRLFQQNEAPATASNPAAGPRWYSAVKKAVEGAKQAKNTGAAWWSVLSKTPGVKQEELELLGLKEFLDGLKGSVPRETVLDFIKQNEVQLEEIDLGKDLAQESRWEVESAAQKIGFIKFDLEDSTNGGEAGFLYDRLRSVPQHADGVQRLMQYLGWLEEDLQAAATDPARLEQGILKVASARKIANEVIGAMRALGDEPATDFWLDITNRIDAISAPLNQARHRQWLQRTEYEKWTLPGERRNYRELLFRAVDRAKSFIAPHFQRAAKGLIAHMRVSERVVGGVRAFFIEEIQSDLHQKGRDFGYRMPEKVRQRRAEALAAEFDGALGVLRSALVEHGLPANQADTVADDASRFLTLSHGDREALDAALENPKVDAALAAAQAIRTQWNAVTDDVEPLIPLRAAFDEAQAALGELGRNPAYASAEPGTDLYREAQQRHQEAHARVEAARTALIHEQQRLDRRVPEAPWRDSYEELALKRALLEAAQHGFEKIAWTTGNQQAERYNLRKSISSVSFWKSTRLLEVRDTNGNPLVSKVVKDDAEMVEAIGKDLTRRLMSSVPVKESPPKFKVNAAQQSLRYALLRLDALSSDGVIKDIQRLYSEGRREQVWEAYLTPLSMVWAQQRQDIDEAGQRLMQAEAELRDPANAEEVQSLKEEGLEMGGEGMRLAYDQRIPSVVKKLIKKYGGTIQQERVGDAGPSVWTATIPAALREAVKAEGMPLFQKNETAREPNLLVQHNLTEENLKHAVELGGFAAPSLAVASKDAPLANFGEVTLLGDSGLADPKKGTPLYDADVYSPRHPRAEFTVDERKASSAQRDLQALAPELSPGEFSETLRREGVPGLLGRYRDRAFLGLAMLRSKGEQVDVPMRSPRTPQSLSWASQPAMLEFFRANGASRDFKIGDDYHLALSAAALAARQQYREELNAADAGMGDDVDEGFERDFGTPEFGPKTLYLSAADALASYGQKVLQGNEVDRSALEELMRERLKSRQDELETWATERLGGLVGPRALVSHYWTSDGRRRTRRVPYTLDNILAVMTRRIRAGEGFDYGAGSTRSRIAKRFRSLEAVKESEGRLVDNAAMDAAKQAWSQRLHNLEAQLYQYAQNKGNISNALMTSIGEGLKPGKSLANELVADGFLGVPPKLVAQIRALGEALKEMPTEYFEAKPQRIVTLSEFKVAVVPASAKPETKQALLDAGLKLHEYEGDEAARAAAIAKAAQESNLLFQDEDKVAQQPRGYIEIPPTGVLERVFRIFLNKRADASTIMHESAHAWLEWLHELALAPEASEKTKAHLAQVRRWLEASDDPTVALTVEQHERFAKGFEKYLMEGRAPLPELEGIFTRFRLWLTDIYRSLKGIDVELNEDARRVFDAFLATDDELEAYRKASGPELFATAEEAGMTPAEFRDYQDSMREADAAASQRVVTQALRERARELDAWWLEKAALVEEKASADYDALPATKVWKAIREGIDIGDGRGEPIAFDEDAVMEAVGPTRLKRFPTLKEGGTHPDEVAESFGFETGGGMMAALSSHPSKETWVQREVAARMAKEHPRQMNERENLRAAIAKAVAPNKERRLLEELAALTARGSKDNPKPPPPVEALREAAKRIAAATKLRDVQPGWALAAERAAANEKARASATKNVNKALDAAQRQLLNAALYQELLKAKEERERLLELAQEMSAQKARARWGKASPVYRDAIDFLVAAVQLTGETQLSAQEWAAGWAALGQAGNLMTADGVSLGDWLGPLGELLVKNDWRNLTVAEMRTLREALENIGAAARQRNTVLLDGKRVEKDTVVEAMLREITAAPKPTPGTASANTAQEDISAFFNAAVGFLLAPSDLVRELTGDNKDSTWWRALVDTFQQAKTREADLLNETIKPIIKAFEAIPKEVRKRLHEKVDGARLFPRHVDFWQPPRKRFELLMMALNMGNAGNMQRLTDGRGITEAEVVAALNVLTKEELDWVQSIFDAAEALRPEAFALEERDSGLKPEPVRARPLTLKNGTLRGGYFPAVYERSASQVGERQSASNVAELLDQSYTRGSTPHSHLKERADKVEAVISLEPNTIYRHFAQVTHDIAFREAVKSVGSLILDPRIDAALKRHLGDGKARQFLQWVKDVGTMRGLMPHHAFNQVLMAIRRNAAPAILGWSIPTALGDLSNPAAALSLSDLKPQYLAAGLAEFAMGRTAAKDRALKLSGELRFMKDTLRRDFAKQVSSLTARGPLARGPLAWWRDHAFTFMEAVQGGTSTPIWLGAFQQAKAERKSDADAARFADQVLRDTFPSHSPVDQAAILRDRGFWGMATMFYGYLSTMFRGQWHLIRRRKLVRLVALWVSAGVLGEFLMGRGPEASDGDDEAERWRNWFMRKLVAAPLSTLPFEAAGTFENRVLGKPTNPRGSPVNALLDTVLDGAQKALDGDAEAADRVKAAMRAAGPLTGIPTRPFVSALSTLSSEDELDTMQTIEGFVYDRKKEQRATPLRPLGD